MQEPPGERVTGPVPLVPVRAAALRYVRVVAVPSLSPFVGANWAEDGGGRQADVGHAVGRGTKRRVDRSRVLRAGRAR